MIYIYERPRGLARPPMGAARARPRARPPRDPTPAVVSPTTCAAVTGVRSSVACLPWLYYYVAYARRLAASNAHGAHGSGRPV